MKKSNWHKYLEQIGGRDYDSPEQQAEEEEMMGELPWYSSESGDGWNTDSESIAELLDVLGECQRLEYELLNARRGSYAVRGDTAEDLVDHCQNLLDQFSSAVENISTDIELNKRRS